jgi:multisubunit Na+/H+ antiporter MnhB subunit
MKDTFILFASVLAMMFGSAALYAWFFSPALGMSKQVFVAIFAVVIVIGMALTNYFIEFRKNKDRERARSVSVLTILLSSAVLFIWLALRS